MELAVAEIKSSKRAPARTATPQYEDNRERDKKLMKLIHQRRTSTDKLRSDAAWELLWDGDPEAERPAIAARGGDVNKGYKRLVYSEVSKFMKNWDDIEDAVSVVKLALRKQIEDDKINTSLSLIPLIVTYVKNHCINEGNRIAKRQTDTVGNLTDAKTGKIDPTALAYYNFADKAPSPRDIAQNNELALQIEVVFDSLPEKDRDILIMQHLEGMSYKEISEALGIKMGTVMSRLSNARQKFAKLFNAIQADDPENQRDCDEEDYE